VAEVPDGAGSSELPDPDDLLFGQFLRGGARGYLPWFVVLGLAAGWLLLQGRWLDAGVLALSLVVVRRHPIVWLLVLVVLAFAGPALVWAGGVGLVVVVRVLQAVLTAPERQDGSEPAVPRRALLTSPHVAWQLRRADRSTRRARPADARRQLDALHAAVRPDHALRPWVDARLAVARMETSDLQGAIDLVHALEERGTAPDGDPWPSAIARSVEADSLDRTGQVGAARDVMAAAIDAAERSHRLGDGLLGRWDRRVMDLDLRLGRTDDVQRRAAAALHRPEVRRDPRSAAPLYLLAARAMAAEGRTAEAGELLENGEMLASWRYLRGTESTFVFVSRIRRLREIAVETADFMIERARIRPPGEQSTEDLEKDVGFAADGAAGLASLVAGDLVRAARCAQVLAEEALRRRHGAERSAWFAARAYAALVDGRDQLRRQELRSAWTQAYEQTVSTLLEATWTSGRAHLLEVIESVRTQAAPTGAPRGEIELDDELPLAPGSHWLPTPRPRTAIGRLRTAGRPVETLQGLLASLSDRPSLWFTSWVADEQLYWGLLAPGGRTSGGRIDLREGSPAQEALRALSVALPEVRPGETAPELERRMDRSALDHTVQEERHLTGHVARALLPDEVVDALRGHAGDSRPILYLAPAPEVVRVPWWLLPTTDQDTDERLADVADCVLAPPPSVLGAAARRAPVPPAGVGLAVLDPTGTSEPGSDLPSDGLLPLGGAQALLADLPTGAAALTGPWDPQRPDGTPDQVEAALTRVAPGQVAYFACHAAPGPLGRSGEAALVLAGPAGALPARELFAGPDRGGRFRLPAEVVLSACDSAGAASSVGGEWFALAPAVIANGAVAVVASVTPVLDDAPVDCALLQLAERPGRRLLTAELLDLQRSFLDAWRGGDLTHGTPLDWASYVAIGCVDVVRHEPPHPGVELEDPGLSRRASALLTGDSGFSTILGSPSEVTSVDVASICLADDDEDTTNGLHAAIVHNLFNADLPVVEELHDLVVHLSRRAELRRTRQAGARSSEEVHEVRRQAIDAVRGDGRSVVQAQDVALALLATPSAGRRMLRVLRYGQRDEALRRLAGRAGWSDPTT
jgi:hypothetical protein